MYFSLCEEGGENHISGSITTVEAMRQFGLSKYVFYKFTKEVTL